MEEKNMNTNKILSIVAIALAGVGLFFGGILLELPALILSIIVLASKKPKDSLSKILSIIALIVSIIAVIYTIVMLIAVLGVVNSMSTIGTVAPW